tara:strand:+ start:95 stop:451 length:357 start_codon:yes stop_codon:yes gene_type:complete
MKITLEQQERGKQLHQELVQKAWESAAFKEQLINNPEATIAEITGVKSKTTNDVKIVVEDQTDENVIYLNIPQNVNIDNFELTDEQLEMVAGGSPFYALGVAIVGVFMAGYRHGQEDR